MLKAADALAESGYSVRVVSSRYVGWAGDGDEDLRRARKNSWGWSVVDWGRESARAKYLWSGLRHRVAGKVAGGLGVSRCPLGLAATAQGRIYPELRRAALAEDVDLIYGGTNGALAAVASAARRMGVSYGLDLEDFHSAEQEDGPASRRAHELIERIESSVLPSAAFLTAGSAAIAEAYREKYGVRPITINNTFPLPAQAPELSVNGKGGLKLYWFSQTVGPQRGLEDAIQAMALARIPGELHLRGRAIPGYLESLRRMAGLAATPLKIVHHEPASPESMFELCRGYDVGLATEPGFSPNNLAALSNKAFTYMLGGLAVAFTETPGQRPLAADIGDASLLYKPGDVEALAAGLKRWADDKELLARSKAAAWEAARRRWHWEHEDERGALLRAVAGALGN